LFSHRPRVFLRVDAADVDAADVDAADVDAAHGGEVSDGNSFYRNRSQGLVHRESGNQELEAGTIFLD
jgi:hypothetical protein